MTQRLETRIDRYTPAVLSVFRIFFGLLFLFEGLSKVFDWPQHFGFPPARWPYWYAGVLELILGALITSACSPRSPRSSPAGRWPSPTSHQHIEKSFWPDRQRRRAGRRECCFGFLLLVFTGGGAYALDAARGRR